MRGRSGTELGEDTCVQSGANLFLKDLNKGNWEQNAGTIQAKKMHGEGTTLKHFPLTDVLE